MSSLNQSRVGITPSNKKAGNQWEAESFVRPGVSLDDVREVKEVYLGR